MSKSTIVCSYTKSDARLFLTVVNPLRATERITEIWNNYYDIFIAFLTRISRCEHVLQRWVPETRHEVIDTISNHYTNRNEREMILPTLSIQFRIQLVNTCLRCDPRTKQQKHVDTRNKSVGLSTLSERLDAKQKKFPTNVGVACKPVKMINSVEVVKEQF